MAGNHQNRQPRFSNDSLCNAANDETFQSSGTVRPHEEKIGAPFFCEFENGLRNITFGRFHVTGRGEVLVQQTSDNFANAMTLILQQLLVIFGEINSALSPVYERGE